MLIGQKIQELRRTKKMSLTELANKSGVQIATLSRIENRKMTGTLESHLAIAKALGIDVSHLYREASLTARPSQKSDKSNPKAGPFVCNDKVSCETLGGNGLLKKMVPAILRIDENGRSNEEKNRDGSERFVFVLEGNITAIVGGQAHPLAKDNSLYFDASQKHHFVNNGNGPARLISIITVMA